MGRNDLIRTARIGVIAAALATALAAVAAVPAPVAAQRPAGEHQGAAALGLALRKLGTTERVLMIAAHPDDENTGVLAALALGRGADVAYLSLTRGDGGQNGIGPELQEAIGLIRSEELLAARRLDGAGQFFTRAYDYGFSKSADEAFRHWPKDSVLADVVAVIRRFRPDIVVSVFSGTPRDGHGQHQAAGILAREAFAVAGDPSRFPDQLARGLRPHSPSKLYQALWRGAPDEAYALETGVYDPLFGRSYHQIAAESRSRHRSQDMGQAELPGPRAVALVRLDAGPPSDPPFEGLSGTTAGRAASLGADQDLVQRLREYDAVVARARDAFNPFAPDALVPHLTEALALLDGVIARLEPRGDASAEQLRYHLAAERDDLHAAVALAAGLTLDVIADAERVVPGETFALELTVWNGGTRPVHVHALEPALPDGWRATAEAPLSAEPVAPGALLTRRFSVAVPADAPPTEPYHLRAPRDGDLYRWPDDIEIRGLPFEPRAVQAVAEIEVAGARVPLEDDAVHRTVSSTEGEIRRPVRVVPAVSVRLEPAVAVLPLGGGDTLTKAVVDGARNDAGGAASPAPLSFTVHLIGEARAGAEGTLRLVVPEGWRVEPAAVPVRFAEPGESRTVTFRAVPPEGTAPGAYTVRAVFERAGGARYDRGYELIDYPHIQPRALYRPAATTVQAFDVRVLAGLRVAYVLGAGDQVPDALAQLGIALDVIDPAALGTTDLDGYDAVVLGTRAYEHRPEVREHNRRLLDYVEAGGTLVVQYNQYAFSNGGYAPYPLTIGRPHDRVTDEEAPVRLLDPSHPVLSWPNRIDDADFEGWVQERGLYFARSWDERYTPLLEMSDPGEAPLRGGLLVAEHGKGTYVYTGLALFRQLPAGVPGAYRLFANLLSIGRHER